MSKTRGHEPIRTCISCGRRHRKKDLLRLILRDGNLIVVDESKGGRGRGGYVCKETACLQRIKGRKISDRRLQKAFRTERPVTIHLALGKDAD